MRGHVDLGQGLTLSVAVEKMGADLAVTISGGSRPHVGSVALAVPRESLRGDGSRSATTSVINVTGHKDDAIGTAVAAALAASEGCVVTVTCGVHYDGVTPEQLRILAESADMVIAKVREWL